MKEINKNVILVNDNLQLVMKEEKVATVKLFQGESAEDFINNYYI